MHYYFISDLHLSKENPETLSDFKNFSQNCIKPNSQVYILGDLFEVWIGDDHEDNFGTPLGNPLGGIKSVFSDQSD